MDQAGFVLKVFLLSAVLAIVVKYGGRMLPLAPTSSTALIGILMPTLIVALALWWRSGEAD